MKRKMGVLHPRATKRPPKPMTGAEWVAFVETLPADQQTILHRLVHAAVQDQEAGRRDVMTQLQSSANKDFDGMKLMLDDLYPVQ